MKKRLLISCLLLTSIGFSVKAQSIFSKLQTAVTSGMTEKSSDLSQIKVDAELLVNCYPKSSKATADDEFLHLETIWPEKGGNLVFVSLKHLTAMKFIELDGSVKLGDEILPHLGSGYYGKVITEVKPYTISITSSTGKSVSFIITPVEKLEVTQPDNNTINLKDGFTIKINNTPTSSTSQIRCALYTKPSITQNGWGTIDYFRSHDEVFVSPNYFVIGNDWNNTYSKSYVKGKSFLLTERYHIDKPTAAPAGDIKLISRNMDIKNVTVEFPKISSGTKPAETKKEGVNISDNGVEVFQNDVEKTLTPGYKLHKPFVSSGMVLGAPIAGAKKVAIICFNVAAKELTQSKSSLWGITYELGFHDGQLTADKVEHIQTETRKLPKMPAGVWEKFTGKLYTDFTAALNSNGMEVLPVETVKAAPSYKNLVESATVYDEETYSTTYKGLKKYSGANIGNWITNATITLGNLANELKVDAIIITTVDITMGWDYSLNPVLIVKMVGPPNGYNEFRTTTYFDGVILARSKPLPEKEIAAAKPTLLEKAVDNKTLFSTFNEAVGKLKAEEEKSEYYKMIQAK